jgi:hypothetical protein
MVFTILTVFLWRKSETKFMKSHTNCDNPFSNFLQEACSGLPIAACDFKVVIKNSFQNRPWLYSYTGENQPMRSKVSQNRSFNRLPEPSLKLVSFFKEASRNCIARYALSRVIHRIQSEIFFGNPGWYLEWLGTVDHRYPAYHSAWEPPLPLFCGNPKINRYCRPNKIH